MATCPQCGDDVTLPDDLETGEILDCGTCGAELEVLGVDPVELDEAPEMMEDWGE
jgi:alpha-aminoadipate carrier protein LysW